MIDWRSDISAAIPQAVFSWPKTESADGTCSCLTASDTPETEADDEEYTSEVSVYVHYWHSDADAYFNGIGAICEGMKRQGDMHSQKLDVFGDAYFCVTKTTGNAGSPKSFSYE